MKNKILLLMFMTFLSITSCSTRKVDLNKSKEVSEIKKDSLVIQEKASVKEIEIKYNIDKWIETIEPIDTSKDIVIIDSFGKKTTLKNARIKREKLSDKSEIKEKISITENNKVQKKSTENKVTIQKTKQTEKTYSWTNIFWLLVPIGLYFGYKQYKDKLWFV
jgi:carbamoylphosphate synthase small subunit